MFNKVAIIQNTEIVQAKPISDLDRVQAALLGNISESSQRIYKADAGQFLTWLAEKDSDPATVGFELLTQYRQHLATSFSKVTAARKLVVARRLLDVAVILKMRPDNPAQQVKGFKAAGEQETPHRALTTKEAKALLATIDQATLKGKRDYALLMLLIRTGMRRAEAAGLTLGDFGIEQGHHVLTIQHGKGDKRRKAKVPVDVMRAVSDYLEAAGRKDAPKETPLFCCFHGRAVALSTRAMTGLDIERTVEHYAALAGLEGLTPHGLRASFVTLTLEAGAKLQQVQYAVGHSDPRTTERYQKRKLNLDDNAVDYLRL